MKELTLLNLLLRAVVFAIVSNTKNIYLI